MNEIGEKEQGLFLKELIVLFCDGHKCHSQQLQMGRSDRVGTVSDLCCIRVRSGESRSNSVILVFGSVQVRVKCIWFGFN